MVQFFQPVINNVLSIIKYQNNKIFSIHGLKIPYQILVEKIVGLFIVLVMWSLQGNNL